MMLDLMPIKSKAFHVDMNHKPLLGVVQEHAQIKAYPPQIRNKNTFKLFQWLLDMLGVKGASHTDGHHDRAIEFIHMSLNHYTYQEIILAFQMYIKGDLSDSKGNPLLVMQHLNAVVIGRVMNAYQRIKKNELHVYRSKKITQMEIEQKKKLTEEEKKIMMFINMLNYWDDYKTSGSVDIGGHIIFERFVKKGIIGHPSQKKYKNYYALKMLKAKQLLLEEHQSKRSKYASIDEYKKILTNIKSGMSISIEHKAKCLVVQDYFEKLIQENIELKDILHCHWNYQTTS